MQIDWSDKVLRDFRKRILVDANSPILAFKANRDRFYQKKYAGMAHLGSVNSEDALTWNVFRSLQETRCLEVITDWLHVEIGKPRAMLIWCLAPESTDAAGELQFHVGDLLRSSDGIIRGQMGEPDVVIQGSEGILIIECKLGEPCRPLAHLWEGRSVERIMKRLTCYQQDAPEPLKGILSSIIKSNKIETDIKPIYQLVRMAYYVTKLGQPYRVRPTLVSLGNEFNWSLQIRKLGKSPVNLWDTFLNSIGAVELRCVSSTWQALQPALKGKELEFLHRYLADHPCLRCSAH